MAQSAEKQEIERIKNLPLFQSVTISLPSRTLVVTRVPGGYLYDNQFAAFNRTMTEDFDSVKE